MGEVKMLPFYFGRESMFCESDFQIPGTVSAGTRAISFKVISRFPIRELQLPPCHLHLSLILIQVLMYFLGKETQFYINYKSINPSYILGSPSHCVSCIDLNLSREGCPGMNI